MTNMREKETSEHHQGAIWMTKGGAEREAI